VVAEIKNSKNLIMPQMLKLKKENLIGFIEQGLSEVVLANI
jgi:hypothetical protein